MLLLTVASFCYRVQVIDWPGLFTLGESPHWDQEKQELYFVDILDSKVYRYVPSTEEIYSVAVGG